MIDFHDSANANTYASRKAHPDWFTHVQSVLDGRQPGTVADVGCGGGIYSRAWSELGAESVIGLDSSAQMIADARAATNDESVRFSVSDASKTALEASSCDIVFSRAVVHHLDDHQAAMNEAIRILKPGGRIIVQDRTIEDVMQPSSPRHFRAHFFEAYPRLLDDERRRRPGTEEFQSVLAAAGFGETDVRTLWETRQVYQDAENLRADLLSRTGRSILHNLNDAELASLAETILEASAGHFPLEEQDRWTMWTAVKPIDR